MYMKNVQKLKLLLCYGCLFQYWRQLEAKIACKLYLIVFFVISFLFFFLSIILNCGVLRFFDCHPKKKVTTKWAKTTKTAWQTRKKKSGTQLPKRCRTELQYIRYYISILKIYVGTRNKNPFTFALNVYIQKQ